jgi:hypothetical protein
VAWAAPNANRNGIHLEHAGYAAQSAADWSDPYSETMLQLSAPLAADICTRWKIPIVFCPAVDIANGHGGITTHAEVTIAYHTVGGHTDPGPGFPMAHYINLVHEAAGSATSQEVRPVVNAPVVAVLSHPAWNGGYIEIGADGGTFSWGAPNFGSAGGAPINSPVVGAAVSPDGQGYWLVAADGGVFSYGDAGFHGSMGGQHINAPVVGMAASPTGAGYWLVARDGGIFSFGDATFKGAVQYQGT